MGLMDIYFGIKIAVYVIGFVLCLPAVAFLIYGIVSTLKETSDKNKQ